MSNPNLPPAGVGTKPRQTPTVSNHYVPRWYQRRFLMPGETRLRYLDLRPDRIEEAPGRKYRTSLMYWSPDRCFARDHRLRYVLETDDIYFGSSRMVELVLGRYEAGADYSVSGEWEPAEGRPLHATSVDHVSLVAWSCSSTEAARRKAQHFRGVVGRASKQLPGDRPGLVHVGYEATGGNSVDGLRNHLNRREMQSFDPGQSRLRAVYGNYFMSEHVTARNESAAVTETTAWYPVGRAGRRKPLQDHLLFTDENGRRGAHFKR